MYYVPILYTPTQILEALMLMSPKDNLFRFIADVSIKDSNVISDQSCYESVLLVVGQAMSAFSAVLGSGALTGWA